LQHPYHCQLLLHDTSYQLLLRIIALLVFLDLILEVTKLLL
jgi:hypothetical protein